MRADMHQSASDAQPCISFDDLTVGYGSRAAIHHLSGVIRRGSVTAIFGPNGSGKSTLIKSIVGLLKPMHGKVRITAGTSVAYLPQQSEIDRSFPARVVDLVSLGLWRKRGLLGRHRPEDRRAVSQALHTVGLAGFERRAIDSLSGGQFQRALFARVIVQNAELILLDEPFNAIDEKTIRDLIAVIAGWRAEGRTVVVVAHDLELVRRHFPETLLLARRRVAWGPTAQVLTPTNLRHARDFHEAWDENAPWCAPDHSADAA